eukprot:5512649-Pyramimonas_sp.AAC.1
MRSATTIQNTQHYNTYPRCRSTRTDPTFRSCCCVLLVLLTGGESPSHKKIPARAIFGKRKRLHHWRVSRISYILRFKVTSPLANLSPLGILARSLLISHQDSAFESDQPTSRMSTTCVHPHWLEPLNPAD